MTRTICVLLLATALAAAAGAVRAQQQTMEDVIRNLRNPDPKARFAALRALREERYVEAQRPIAALINDRLDEIQLEAIGTELSFYLVEDIPAKTRRGLVVEVRNRGAALQAFERGPLAAWPAAAPAEVVDELLKAIDDENQRVRIEAIYTLGIVAQPPLGEGPSRRLIKALDHYDPVIRAAAARVIARCRVGQAGDTLIQAINDSNPQVRYASMRALGELGVDTAIQALTEQFKYYGKGEGAWSALDALARIAHESSVPLFKSRIADKDEFLRRAAAEGLGRTGDKSEIGALQAGASSDASPMVRTAMTFALQKLGQNYVARLVDFMTTARLVPQVQAYLLELGPPIVPELLPRLQESDSDIRARVVDVLGAIGDESTLASLTPLEKDRDRGVVAAAQQAIERIKMGRR